jgi:O-antigen biosynthesis protein
VFLGGFRHAPNVDGARYLLEEILPCIRRSLPDVPLTILGSDPPKEIIDKRDALTSVPGYLEDIDTPLSLARVAVVPLRFGAGMKGKIYRAMAVGTPNVSTTVGAEAMDLIDGENVRIADSPQGLLQLADSFCRKWRHPGRSLVISISFPHIL